MDEQVFRVVIWIAGILVTCLIALVAYVWKTGQAEIRSLKFLVEAQQTKIEEVRVRLSAIETKCSVHDNIPQLTTDSIRAIVKEELVASNKELKLSLIEDGYIKQQQPKTTKSKG